jgi:hypothetical protein
MKQFIIFSTVAALFGALLLPAQSQAARGEHSFNSHMSAARVSNAFGYTYRYQKHLGTKPAYQYRKQEKGKNMEQNRYNKQAKR